MTHKRSHAGFTLIELLVALVILTFISVAGYRGLNSVLQARERVAEETRKWQHLAFFFSRMELDIAQAVHRPVRNATGGLSAEWIGKNIVAGEDDAELIFTRSALFEQISEMSPPLRVAYRLERGAIIMLRWPNLDQAPHTKPVRYPLLEGVREFKLRYMDRNNNWQTQWTSTSAAAIPFAVEVNITLASGEQVTRIFALQ